MLKGGEKLFEIGLADEEIRIFFDVSDQNAADKDGGAARFLIEGNFLAREYGLGADMRITAK